MAPRRSGEPSDDLQSAPDVEDPAAETIEAQVGEFGLAGLRTRRLKTQADIARAMGTTQSAVSRLERQRDVLMSTLGEYVSATGGRFRVVAEYADYAIELRLSLPGPTPEMSGEREFDVVWQNQETRKLVPVGELRIANGTYEFRYTLEATLDADFQPFASFPSLDDTYLSDELFGFFKDRVVFTAKPGFDDVAAALGLRADAATPVELLERSWGLSPHDTIQIVPRPVELPDGTLRRYFLVSGVSHIDGSAAHVAKVFSKLKSGQRLRLVDEPENPSNSKAVLLAAGNNPVGWIPNYLVDEVHKYRDDVAVFVEHANEQSVPPHLRLLCRLDRATDA